MSFSYRGAGGADGSGRKRAQCRLEQSKRFQGSSRDGERKSGQPNSRKILHAKRVLGTRNARRIECHLLVDWIRLHFFEEDVRKVEESDRETQQRQQVSFLDEKEVEQLKKDKGTIGEHWIFLKQHRDNSIEPEM